MNVNFNELFGKMQTMQQELQKVRDSLDTLVVTAEAGGGMVTATASAAKRLIKIQIEPTAMSDREMLEDLITAAVNKVLEKAEEKAKEHLAQATKDMLPGGGLPGLDLSQLGL